MLHWRINRLSESVAEATLPTPMAQIANFNVGIHPMNEMILTGLFLAALGISVAIQWWLSSRHTQHIKAHRAEVPAAFADRIDLDSHQKAADYTLAKVALGKLELLFSSALLLVWTLGGGLELLNTLWLKAGWSELWTGSVFLLSMFAIISIIDIPFSLYRTFVLESRFGFNNTTMKTFIIDFFKGMILTAVIGVPLLLVVLWLMGNTGPLWWLWVWAVWTGFGLFMMWAYPAFIAPFFNKFSELEEGALRDRIVGLLQRCGFKSNGIFIVDGSKRSGHGNAYFTGLGKNKRIVFFDTLIESLNDDEVEAVLAHELGHFKHKHILKRIVSMTIFSLCGLALLGWLISQNWFYTGLGMSEASLHGALALFMLVIPVFTFFLHPIMAAFSRKHEFEADAFAAEVSNAGTLIMALVKLYKENANTLTPDPLYSSFHDSHPPASIRIAHLTEQGANKLATE